MRNATKQIKRETSLFHLIHCLLTFPFDIQSHIFMMLKFIDHKPPTDHIAQNSMSKTLFVLIKVGLLKTNFVCLVICVKN